MAILFILAGGAKIKISPFKFVESKSLFPEIQISQALSSRFFSSSGAFNFYYYFFQKKSTGNHEVCVFRSRDCMHSEYLGVSLRYENEKSLLATTLE